jgi:hypothetical protein
MKSRNRIDPTTATEFLAALDKYDTELASVKQSLIVNHHGAPAAAESGIRLIEQAQSSGDRLRKLVRDGENRTIIEREVVSFSALVGRIKAMAQAAIDQAA